ncbi:MAG TPA: penicillin-binding protein 1C [Paracoccaceae bacterium]|nr:penicillin-binding protein 1C [Paracoccaceae bacterium]
MGRGGSRRAGRRLIALALALWAGAAALDGARGWIDATVLPPLSVETSVEVVARDGRLLRAYTVEDGRWRMALDPGQVDPAFVAMLLAYEDRRFRSHPGVDARALARAAWQSLRAGRVVSGGSTLTMQVARLLEDSGTGRMQGKLRQMRVALALERRLSKDQILGLYLHLAPYGGNVEGLRAATLAWFGKEPRRLTPAEAALLVALPQAPEARRPDRHAARAADARDRVLARAVVAGLLDNSAAQAAGREPVPMARRPVPMLAPHLADRLRLSAPDAGRHATTLDAGLQLRLDQLAAEIAAGQGERVQVAILAADHRSGEILASVGSAAYRADARQGFVDMTRAVRSPGSLLKPLVYALAFDQGLAHPETLLEDRPTDFNGYAPQNFDRRTRGTIRAREALQQSLNIPVVALTEALGPARLMTALRAAGARPRLPGTGAPGLAVALGGVGMTLEELTGLYAALARGGVGLPLRATGAGSEGQRLVSAIAAWQAGDILSGLPPPPGQPANRLAYKTGTSYGHRDAWAIGWDGAHVVGVWLGRADGTPVPGAFGADLAAPVLFQAFQRLKPALTPLPPPPTATLLVSNPQLPPPLQRFRSRNAALAAEAADAPAVAFPRDGTEVELMPEGLMLRVRGGRAPFTWLIDGAPVATALSGRETVVEAPGRGFVTLSVIDAAGRSARVRVRLR